MCTVLFGFGGDDDSTISKCWLGVEVLILLTLAVTDGSRLSLAAFRGNLIPSGNSFS